jgi:GNAT superfamily N-acetyltransferase
MSFEIHPLTRDRWSDLVELFNRPGGSIVRGCWCMHYRKTGRNPAETFSGDENKQALKALVDRGYVPGLIGYEDGSPVGWVSISPREDYLRLRRSPVMKPLDDEPVWSIVCFFVDKKARGKGFTEELLKGAVDYARSRGAALLEGYPVEKSQRSHPDFMWFGAKSIFDRAGFQEVARRKEHRPIMRRRLDAVAAETGHH